MISTQFLFFIVELFTVIYHHYVRVSQVWMRDQHFHYWHSRGSTVGCLGPILDCGAVTSLFWFFLKYSSLMLLLPCLQPTALTLAPSHSCLVCQQLASVKAPGWIPLLLSWATYHFFFLWGTKTNSGKSDRAPDLWSYLHDKCAAVLVVTHPHRGLKISAEIKRNSAAQDLPKVRQRSKSGHSLRVAAPSLIVQGDGVLGGWVQRAFATATVSFNVCPLHFIFFGEEGAGLRRPPRYILFGYNGFDIVGYDPCL